MIFGDLGDLKLHDICLTSEEKPRKNFTQETCPDRGSNPGPLRDKRACYHLLHTSGHSFRWRQPEQNTDKGHTHNPRTEIKITDPAALESRDSTDHATATDQCWIYYNSFYKYTRHARYNFHITVDHMHIFWPHKDMEGLPGEASAQYRATSETPRTWKTIHTIHAPIHSDKVNVKGWLWRPNDIRGPCEPNFLIFVLQVRKNPKKTSPRRFVPTGHRTRARCVTDVHATACSTAVDFDLIDIIKNSASLYFHNCIVHSNNLIRPNS